MKILASSVSLASQNAVHPIRINRVSSIEDTWPPLAKTFMHMQSAYNYFHAPLQSKLV